MPHYSRASLYLPALGAEPRTDRETSVLVETPPAITTPEVDIMVAQSAYKQANHCYGDIVEIPNVADVPDPTVAKVMVMPVATSAPAAPVVTMRTERAVASSATREAGGTNGLFGSMMGRCVMWSAIGLAAAYLFARR